MAFCICHISALEFWRSLGDLERARLRNAGALKRTTIPPFGLSFQEESDNAEDALSDASRLARSASSETSVAAEEIRRDIHSFAGSLRHPLHVLVSAGACRRKGEGLTFHVHEGDYTPGSFFRVGDGYVVSPELAFVQYARDASLVDVLRVGAELTGSYAALLRTPEEAEGPDALGFRKGELVTTLARLRDYVKRASREHGIKRARVALRYLPDGCASPMESALFLLLSLPRAYGGYGLPRPEANYRISAPDDRRGAMGKSCFICDLYWPQARLCVEYDSNMFHTGAQRIARDSARRNALALKGITVVSVTGNQIMDRVEMDRAAYLIAKKLGFRPSTYCSDFPERQAGLRAALLPLK